MSTVAERVEVVEDRLDRVERLVAWLAEDTARYREEAARDRAERVRDREEAARDRAERVRDREEAARDRAERVRYREEAARDRAERVRDREEAARDRAERVLDREARAQDREARARDREESVRMRREMNKRWGELANKMGTVVEDIVAPSVRRMAREVFDCGDELLFTSRITRARGDDRSRSREFDVLYVGTRAVLLNETKSSPRGADVRRFARLVNSGEFFLYFPEYRDLPLVPMFSSLSLPRDLVTFLTRNRIYALAMGDEAMQVMNLDAVRKRPAEPRPTH